MSLQTVVETATPISSRADLIRRNSSSLTVYDSNNVHLTSSSAAQKSEGAVQTAEKIGLEPTNVLFVQPIPETIATPTPSSPLQYSKGRRWFLLLVFSLASFLDISCRSGVVLFTEQIALDLNIVYQSSTWIITSFSVPFACFLLFWGRVSDLFSPKLVFVGGFTMLGVSCAVVSVCPDMISFFIFRGFCGMFCSATIPAAFRLIMLVFEGKERGVAITVFSLSGAVANAAGLVLAAFFGFITTTGQMSSWRWYFRFIALLAIPFSTIAYIFIPSTFTATNTSPDALTHSVAEKWKRFDLPGCAIMLSATLLFIVSLTLGATYGWKTAKFLVPFLLSWPVGVSFVFWERRLKQGYALVPPSTWRIRNLSLLLGIAVSAFAYWPSTQLPLIERWQTVDGVRPIICAVRLIPQGLSSVVPMFVLPRIPERFKASRYFIIITYSIIAFMLLPLIYSHGTSVHGVYWRFYFPSFIIASFFGACAFSGVSVSVMASVPSEMSGVAGALLQVFLQIGGAAVFSIQAGLLTIYPGSYSNFHNIQASWWFVAGWYMTNVMLVAVLFRDPKKLNSDARAVESTTAERLRRSGEAASVGEKARGDDLGLVRPPTKEGSRIVRRPEMTRVQSLV